MAVWEVEGGWEVEMNDSITKKQKGREEVKEIREMAIKIPIG
jgi:hypothetical protein